MRKFQCLLFVMKISYILLLFNLHDCILNKRLSIIDVSASIERQQLILEQWIRGKHKISWYIDNIKK